MAKPNISSLITSQDLSLAGAVYGTDRSTIMNVINQVSDNATRIEGTAMGDSSGGYVLVDMGGETVTGDDSQYVNIPTSVSVSEGDTVIISIANNKPVVIAAVGWGDEINDTVIKLGKLVAESVTTEKLDAAKAYIAELTADEEIVKKLKAGEITVDELTAEAVKAGTLDAEVAKVVNLQGETGTFANLIADSITTKNLDAEVANIVKVDAGTVTADVLKTDYATIDFANIGMAAVEKLFTDSGIIDNLTIETGKVTGELVGVTIKGDLIEGGTVVADKLVILGEDGLYYKLNTNGVDISGEQTEYNSLNGKVITAKSIVAEQISVDDLVAFGATIGGMELEDGSIHSVGKDTYDSAANGFYLDKDGQFGLGSEDAYIRFYKDTDGTYKLALKAAEIKALEEGVLDLNSLIRLNGNGVEVAHKEDGEYTSTKTLINASGLQVQSASGAVLTDINTAQVVLGSTQSGNALIDKYGIDFRLGTESISSFSRETKTHDSLEYENTSIETARITGQSTDIASGITINARAESTASGYGEATAGVEFYAESRQKPLSITYLVNQNSFSKPYIAIRTISNQSSLLIGDENSDSLPTEVAFATLEEMLTDYKLHPYPIGAVYISYVSTSPAILFGGSWTQITGRFPYFNAGTSTGGSNTHYHSYKLRYDVWWRNIVCANSNANSAFGAYNPISNAWVYGSQSKSGLSGTTTNGAMAESTRTAQGNQYDLTSNTYTSSTMPAYQTLYAWRRTG